MAFPFVRGPLGITSRTQFLEKFGFWSAPLLRPKLLAEIVRFHRHFPSILNERTL